MPRSNGKERTRLPSTLLNSDKHAQHIWKKAHDSAVKTYGEGERAHRVAWAALKHEYMRVGDKWVPKGWKGPSDPQAAQRARQTQTNGRRKSRAYREIGAGEAQRSAAGIRAELSPPQEQRAR